MERDAIIAEIRRTAAENGGVPLGRDRFEHATGIRPGDWEGRFWARWSDAVREAGLRPNLLNIAYETDFVLENYVTLIRKLGRMPVRNELRMASANTPGFPNDKTFRTHLGLRPEHVAKVRDYARRKGYEDVLGLVPQPAAHSAAGKSPPSAQLVLGSVYLLKAGKHYKIGHSNASGRRGYEIGLLLPDKATLVHEIRTDDPPGIEAYWHRRFADRRGNGEWFSLTTDDVAAFRRRKHM